MNLGSCQQIKNLWSYFSDSQLHKQQMFTIEQKLDMCLHLDNRFDQVESRLVNLELSQITRDYKSIDADASQRRNEISEQIGIHMV